MSNRKRLTAAALCLGMLFTMTGCGNKEAKVDGTENGAEVTAENTDSVSENAKYFIKGADISSLEAVEDYGGKFYDFDGKEVDVIEFLTENGCNYYRLRIWNNPTMSFEAGDYCNLEHTVEMAKRIKESGAEYLLDFHYSDWWADPKNQTIPAAWQGMSEEELANAVYDYTKEVLNTLAEEDAYPDMVQIGNEIGNGMLWEYGSTDNPEALASFLNSGIKAVRETTPEGQETQIMIHVETGGAVQTTEDFFTLIEEHGVTDYDIVGLSYYPYWQGTFAEMKENVNNIYEKFGKQVVLAETAYSYTNDNADDKSNMVSEADIKSVGFEASVENQKLVFELTMNAVAECEGGLGVFYWEPAWLPVDGVGVSKGSGNEWENQLLFDFEGKALESVKAFDFTPGSLDNDTALYVYPFDMIEIDKNATGDALLEELPKTAKVLHLDGSIRDVEVTWDVSSMKTITETHVAFKGTVLEESVSIGADLVDKNALNNLNFEEGATGWITEDEKKAGQICNGETSYPHSGEWSYQYWGADAFDINLYQQVQVTETAQHNLQVWSQGIGESALKLTLYIADKDGNMITSTDFTNDGWNVWQHPCVSAELTEGEIVRIGVMIEAGSDDWGTLDEFSFYTGEVKEDTSALEDGSDVTDDETASEGSTSQETETNTANLIENASFENGENGWEITREGTGSGTVRNDSEGNPYSGEYSFHYWNDTDFSIDFKQEVAVETAGTYNLFAHSQGDSDTETSMTLYIMDESGTVLASTDFSNQGWDVWQSPALENVTLEAGVKVTVGVTIHGKAGGWGTLDDIVFCIGG